MGEAVHQVDPTFLIGQYETHVRRLIWVMQPELKVEGVRFPLPFILVPYRRGIQLNTGTLECFLGHLITDRRWPHLLRRSKLLHLLKLKVVYVPRVVARRHLVGQLLRSFDCLGVRLDARIHLLLEARMELLNVLWLFLLHLFAKLILHLLSC